MSHQPLLSVSTPLAPELLEYNEYRMERYCGKALFGSINAAYVEQMRQAALIFAGIQSYQGMQDDHRLPSHGFGEIARVECICDYRPPNELGSYWLRGIIVFTSGSGDTMPIVHFSDALLGYGGSGPALGRFILKYCGIPDELVKYCEDELEHHDYRIVFSREATHVQEGVVVAWPYDPPDQKWRLIHKEKYPKF